MRLNEVTYTDAKPVDGYGPGFFRIGGEIYRGPVLVLHDGIKPWGGLDDLDPIIAAKDSYDVLFVGTGADIAHLPADMRTTLEDAGIAVEPMDHRALPDRVEEGVTLLGGADLADDEVAAHALGDRVNVVVWPDPFTDEAEDMGVLPLDPLALIFLADLVQHLGVVVAW